jgi:hypothetical protein
LLRFYLNHTLEQVNRATTPSEEKLYTL